MAQAFIGTQTDGFIEWSLYIDRFNCTDLCCRFADVLAAEQSETELLEPCELEGRQSELQRLEEERKNYEGQLLRLQEEVDLMEDEMRRREEGGGEVLTDKDMEKALFGIARSSKEESEGEMATASREHERVVRNLKARIKLNEAFNGIQFSSAEWEIAAKDETSLHRKHIHTGSAHGFLFHVEYLVKEDKSSEGAKDGESPSVLARIVALSVSVEPTSENDLQPFISRVSVDFDLMKFYQTYVKYAILVNERRDSYATAKSKYGASVRVPDGPDRTRLNYRMKAGLSLFFSWTVSVSERGFVDSSLGLQVKSHREVSDEDRETVSHLPLLLQKMIQTRGHRKALASVLALLQPNPVTS
ncbi:Centromere protein P [Geodia barretti]|uniref:Centromere protein P n=1 Tax=Geodia barretti TaxID=519541 RepID=A0AA35WDQ5_GEOBA|nr:Centromere protein P [Geodia barretti]